MGMELTDYSPKPPTPEQDEQRRAAVRIADHIGAGHPHPLDEYMPRIAGAVLAKDPAIATGVLELLAALGIRPDQITRGNR